ncbi:pentatricopeptide repeat-containing protein At4g01030, mitochondrial [Ziziphus jujuba]|uniref:Pentatricopeptide repeat-containing protein At4g01030, mitochondrial n=1 Tax=Ziziphus jujuba TaxID=326968 RepID=A0A6P4AJG5_ZIZJJ|nr:pentatricopeptide repeat-containing protein At4g01030, mitochondrial [Ziziphus jujuba]
MDKLASLNHLNSPFLQNPLIAASPSRSHSPTSLAFGVSEKSLVASLPTSLPRLSCGYHFVDDVVELKTLNSVKLLHTQIVKMANKENLASPVGNLITYYLQFGDFSSASKVYFVGFERNYILWSSFLKEFRSFGGSPREILEVFCELHNAGVIFDTKVLTVVLKLCSALNDWELGVEIHACLIKRGFDLDVFLRCALINFYGTCLGIECADQVLYEMPDQEGMLWKEALMLNVKNERWIEALELFRNMQFSFVKSTSSSITKVLQACGKVGALDEGKQIHGYVLRQALESNLSICNSLISMYSRNNKLRLARNVFNSMKDHNLSSWNSIISSYAAFGCLDDAWNLFNKMVVFSMDPDIVTWNCLLSGHSLNGSYEAALTIFRRMQSAGFKPNSSSITSVLQAVIELGYLNFGKEIHCFVMRNRLDYDVYVGTSLVDMYIKNDCLKSAEAVFHNMKNKNIFAWNSLISGYSFKGLFEDAEKLLSCMEWEGIKPDLVTWNGLVTGYAMWGRNKEGVAVIDRIKNSGLRPNVVSWTALIAGCSKNENYADALKFFIQMQEEGIKPNSTTISSLLRVCAGLSLLHKGEELHSFSIRNGFVEDVFVSTALIDMYSKGGNFRSAHEVFRKIENKTLASWNCMIMGFSIYGFGKEAIFLFDAMCKAGVQPDAITFTALLSGCKNSGLVNEGWKFFDSMKKDYNIDPTIEHCSCMVDLLGRAGYLDEAWDFIQTMPLKPDATIWGALLGSCRAHRNVEFAEIAAKNLFELEPYNSANYVMMLNLYAISNRWEDVERLKNLMRSVGVRIGHVWSWIQIGRRIHKFSAEGKPHPEAGEIYFELYQLVSEMKKLGYVPDISCVHQNIDEAEKEKVLLSHTEKLAITYGLMKVKRGAPIRVIKNTRVCNDCHIAAKFMSLVGSREIFVKEGLRFHHFREGKCSCNDCW